MTNSVRGDYTAMLGGIPFTFDTTLGTVARIEEACGGRSIMELVGNVVSGRRAADQMALLAAALRASGHAEPAAARATVAEAEAFILGLMQALGFRLAPTNGEGATQDGPLAGSNAGGDGANSPSAA